MEVVQTTRVLASDDKLITDRLEQAVELPLLTYFMHALIFT